MQSGGVGGLSTHCGRVLSARSLQHRLCKARCRNRRDAHTACVCAYEIGVCTPRAIRRGCHGIQGAGSGWCVCVNVRL